MLEQQKRVWKRFEDELRYPDMYRREDVKAHPRQCPDPECSLCGERDCPWHEPLHYHHDGCPCCTALLDGESLSNLTDEQWETVAVMLACPINDAAAEITMSRRSWDAVRTMLARALAARVRSSDAPSGWRAET